jgi:hypothetical protein
MRGRGARGMLSGRKRTPPWHPPVRHRARLVPIGPRWAAGANRETGSECAPSGGAAPLNAKGALARVPLDMRYACAPACSLRYWCSGAGTRP